MLTRQKTSLGYVTSLPREKPICGLSERYFYRLNFQQCAMEACCEALGLYVIHGPSKGLYVIGDNCIEC